MEALAELGRPYHRKRNEANDMDLIQMQNWSYILDLPRDLGPIRELLRSYSGIPVEDIDEHVLRIREEAWRISNFPCIGRWKFLGLAGHADPRYHQVLFRLKLPQSRDALLDLGCCLGQALRQLRADGVEGSRLYGADLDSRLIDIGYNMFRDRDHLGATFVVGDMIDPEDHRVSQLEGKVTLIHADSFFHLFNWVQQLYIGNRLVSFLKPGTKNAVIYGRHVGLLKARDPPLRGKYAYLHDQDSFQRLWDEVGTMTNTRWTVELEADGDPGTQLPGVDKDALPVEFTVYQIP